MPTDRSTTDSSAGVMNASGTNQVAPKGAKKPKLRTRRRLRESDVNVVNKPMLKKHSAAPSWVTPWSGTTSACSAT